MLCQRLFVVSCPQVSYTTTFLICFYSTCSWGIIDSLVKKAHFLFCPSLPKWSYIFLLSILRWHVCRGKDHTDSLDRAYVLATPACIFLYSITTKTSWGQQEISYLTYLCSCSTYRLDFCKSCLSANYLVGPCSEYLWSLPWRNIFVVICRLNQ